jgi:hypothetical protein
MIRVICQADLFWEDIAERIIHGARDLPRRLRERS